MAGNKGEDGRGDDRHGWKRSDSKRAIRIDHSDVYIENERLGEDLEYKMANIHRSRYRQFLNRDSEITQLKKSLARMRQVSTSGSILHRAPIGRQRPKPNVPTQTSTTSYANEDNNIRARRETRVKKTSFQHERSPTAPIATMVRNISIKMPHADRNACDSDSLSDDSDDDDDDDEDDEDVDLSSVGSHEDDDIHQGKTHVRHGKNLNKERSLRSKSTFEDTYSTNRRSLSLKQLMRILKLDQIPSAWFTTVVPASDVSFSKRPGRPILYELTNPSNYPHVHSWEPPRAPPSKAVSSPSDRRRQQRHEGFPLRPHTSLGMSRVPEHNQGGLVSQGNSPRSVSKLSRPMTATTQKSSMSSSKTVRQLKEMSDKDEQDAMAGKPLRGVELMLDETKEKRKLLDLKINDFLTSLDELQKVKRWKEQGLNLESKNSKASLANLASFSSANGHYFSGDLVKYNDGKTHPVTSHGATALGGNFKIEATRPATVS